MYQKLSKSEQDTEIKKEDKTSEVEFFKKDLGDGIYEIKELYTEPEKKKKTEKKTDSEKKTEGIESGEAVGFEKFFGKEESQKKNFVSGLDEIKNLLNPKKKSKKKEEELMNDVVAKTKKVQIKEGKGDKGSGQIKKKKRKKERKKEIDVKKEEPKKISIFKQRMMARRAQLK